MPTNNPLTYPLMLNSLLGMKKQERHGMSRTPEYQTWKSMKKRCNNPNDDNYPNYGGRGVKVCDRWDSFINFYKDMGDRPSLKHSIDRIDVNGNYEPSNCRWATPVIQAMNQRKDKWRKLRKIPDSLIIQARELYASGVSIVKVIEKLNLPTSLGTTRRMLIGMTYADVGGPIVVKGDRTYNTPLQA